MNIGINYSDIHVVWMKFTFRLNITDSEDEEPIGEANLGPLYQNQEEDPEVDAKMFNWFNSDELPDLN